MVQEQDLRTALHVFAAVVNVYQEKKEKRDIWKKSEWKNINNLENDDIGRIGEETINTFCSCVGIPANIDGSKTKSSDRNGGKGDGTINNKSIEIKTARLGSNNSSFQHELGETPWNAEYMLFLDIAPDKLYLTVFQNYSEDFYKKSGANSRVKCEPYFSTKSITWRKQKGAFKLDTTIKINDDNVKCGKTFVISTINSDEWKKGFCDYINGIIPL